MFCAHFDLIDTFSLLEFLQVILIKQISTVETRTLIYVTEVPNKAFSASMDTCSVRIRTSGVGAVIFEAIHAAIVFTLTTKVMFKAPCSTIA